MKLYRLKTMVICLGSICFFLPAMRAQVPVVESHASASGSQKKGLTGDEIKDRLGLTDEQSDKMVEILQMANYKMQALVENASMPADVKKAQGVKVLSSVKEQVDALLTPAQRIKFEEIRKEGKDN